MMWTLGLALIGAAVLWAAWPRQRFDESRRVDQLQQKFSELLTGAPKPSVLILEVGKSGPFLQFAHDSELSANFPLVADSNRKLESRFREVLVEHSLVARNEYGSDGAQFLEVGLPEEANQAAAFAQLILLEVFGLKPSSRVKTALLF